MLLGLLFFTFSFFYNKEEAISAVEQWDWECQEEEISPFGQYLGGGEIPIGEAMDGTFAMAKEIIRNYDLMLPAGGQVVAAANAVYELPLPDDCQAENCNTGCEVDSFACNSYDCNPMEVCEEVCDTVCVPLERCRSSLLECENDRPAGSTDCKEKPKEVCVEVERCWGTEAICLAEKPPDETCNSRIKEIIGDFIVWEWCFDEEVCDTFPEWCWEEEICDTFCRDECGPVFDTCWQTCYDCDIYPCTGNACPMDAIVELGDQRAIITTRALQIAGYQAAINTEVQKAPGLRNMLEKARIGLAACVTPASGYEPTEEVQLVETLVSCDEAKWLKMLSDDQEDCYLTNFFCCEPIEK